MKIKISFKKLEHYKGVINGDIDYQYEKPVIYGYALKIELLK